MLSAHSSGGKSGCLLSSGSGVQITLRGLRPVTCSISGTPMEFAGFSFKNPAPMTFCKAVKRRGQPGAVENPGNPPSCGASIGGVPRFMGGL